MDLLPNLVLPCAIAFNCAELKEATYYNSMELCFSLGLS